MHIWCTRRAFADLERNDHHGLGHTPREFTAALRLNYVDGRPQYFSLKARNNFPNNHIVYGRDPARTAQPTSTKW